MYILINNQKVEVIITRKLKQKNTYLRVKDDLNLYVTTSSFVSDKAVKKIIEDNMDSVVRMYQKQSFKQDLKNEGDVTENEQKGNKLERKKPPQKAGKKCC